MKKTTYLLGLLALCFTFSTSAFSQGSSGSNFLPSGAADRLAALSARTGIDTMWREARDRAFARVIDPEDYECGPTDFDIWIGGKLAAMDDVSTFFELLGLGVLDWPTFYSLVFDNDASDEYMGVDGEQTREMVTRHKDNQRFWDVESDDIQLYGMHGAVLADDAKMVPVVQLLFGVDAATAASIVDYAQSLIASESGLSYDHPFFSLNAFAFSAEDEPMGSPFYGLPDKIVMGDGISEALADMGLGINAPDFVHAHEFGHHVQFEIGVFDGLPHTPENTRYTELMADAFGAYYCAHARGASFQAKRIIEAFRASYVIGDCAFDSPNHHGTPNQREAAAEWGAAVAAAAKMQGHINSSATMLDLFDDVFDDLIAPDAD